MNKNQVVRYMNQVIDEYVDPLTGDVGTTQLAEDAIDHFDVNDYDAEDVFDWAVDVAQRYEAHQAKER